MTIDIKRIKTSAGCVTVVEFVEKSKYKGNEHADIMSLIEESAALKQTILIYVFSIFCKEIYESCCSKASEVAKKHKVKYFRSLNEDRVKFEFKDLNWSIN